MATAHQTLVELKATAESMPNQDILISTLSLQEVHNYARASQTAHERMKETGLITSQVLDLYQSTR